MTEDEIADEINRMLKKYPHCGLVYDSKIEALGHIWWLSRMTPVGINSCLRVLGRCGENVAALRLDDGK